MIVKTAIAAHVALLKKQAAVLTDSAQAATEDPNKQVVEAAKQDAARKKALADVAVQRSDADLATAQAANKVQQNQAKREEIEAAQPQPMPGPAAGAGVGGAPTTPGMPQTPPAQTMPAPSPTISAGQWGMQPAKPVAPMQQTAQAGR